MGFTAVEGILEERADLVEDTAGQQISSCCTLPKIGTDVQQLGTFELRFDHPHEGWEMALAVGCLFSTIHRSLSTGDGNVSEKLFGCVKGYSRAMQGSYSVCCELKSSHKPALVQPYYYH